MIPQKEESSGQPDSGALILREGQTDLLAPSIQETHVAQRVIPLHRRRLPGGDVRSHHICLIGEQIPIRRYDDLPRLTFPI